MILDYLFSLLPILSLAILVLKGSDQFPVVMPAVSFRLNIFFHKECIVEVIQFKIVDLLFSQLPISSFCRTWFNFGRQLCRGDQMILGYLIWVDLFHVVVTSVQYLPNIFFLNNTLLKGLILKSSMCNSIL